MFNSAIQRFTIKTSLILRDCGVTAVPIRRLKKWFYFLKIMDLLLTNGDKMRWVQDDLFVDRQLDVCFRVGRDAFLMDIYYKAQNKMSFYKNNGKIYAKVQGLRFHLPFPSGVIELYETFVDECYGFFNVENQTVLDVGGFIGDTPIFFACKGAKKVVSYEPSPPLYALAKENVQLNRFEKKIDLVNEAVGAENGSAELSFNGNNFGGSSIAKKRHGKKYKVNVSSLHDIVEHLGCIDLLKMDCEGAEWLILPKAKEDGTLERINRIVLEIHGTNYEQIITLLKQARFEIQQKNVLDKNLCLVAANK